MEGPVFTALNKLTDLVVLNLLFLLCCVPVFTIGASLSALSYVTMRMRRGEEGYVWKSFFHSFKQNFIQATVIWLGMLVILAILVLDFLLLTSGSGLYRSVMTVALIVGTFLWVLEFLYVFPLQAKFYNPIGQTVKNALLLALANAPVSILLAVLLAGVIFLTLWNYMTIVWGSLIWLLAGFSLCSVVNSHFLGKIFDRLAPPEEKTEPDDPWENL